MKRYFVVDQNRLRTEELSRLLSEDPDARIVIPDLAFLEMTKGTKQELTLQKSLARLSAFPTRAVVCRSVGQSMKSEIDRKNPVANLLGLDSETALLRSVLFALARDPESDEVQRLLNQSTEHLNRLSADYLDHNDNKVRARSLVDSLKSGSNSTFMERVRRKSVTEDERLEFIARKAPSLLRDALCSERFGLSPNSAARFVKAKPMQLRFYYLTLWLALDWAETDRIQGIGAEKVSKDYLDREYVLSATYFHGLLTNEYRMNSAFKALRKLLAQKI